MLRNAKPGFTECELAVNEASVKLRGSTASVMEKLVDIVAENENLRRLKQRPDSTGAKERLVISNAGVFLSFLVTVCCYAKDWLSPAQAMTLLMLLSYVSMALGETKQATVKSKKHAEELKMVRDKLQTIVDAPQPIQCHAPELEFEHRRSRSAGR